MSPIPISRSVVSARPTISLWPIAESCMMPALAPRGSGCNVARSATPPASHHAEFGRRNLQDLSLFAGTVDAKRLELLHELVPQVALVAVMEIDTICKQRRPAGAHAGASPRGDRHSDRQAGALTSSMPAMVRSLSSCFEATRIWRRTEQISSPEFERFNKLRTARWDRFSHPDPLPKYGTSAFTWR
jgi:hypothetical protein